MRLVSTAVLAVLICGTVHGQYRTTTVTQSTTTVVPVVVDALDEVNAYRRARGLRPFVRDPLLTAGAMRLAATRAAVRRRGHFMDGGGDFAYLPWGARAAATGCGAHPPRYGWMTCATYENFTYAGAAWAMGTDGRRYMHLVVR
jgi:hypothetical protein